MIKVNLNKTRSSTVYRTQKTELSPLAASLSTAVSTILTNIKDQRMSLNTTLAVKVMINIILVLCFPIGLKAYEINQKNKLKSEKAQKEKVLATVNEELAILENELKNYDYLQERAEEFKEKKEFLKQLAESRLIIPRTIDLIQGKIPKTVWLESLKLKLSEERGQKLEISGKSFNEAHVNSFANSLHDVLDKNSITVDTEDIKEGGSVIKVKFHLKGVI